MRQLLDHAAENDYGVPAFNVNNLEQMRAIMEGADETQSPVIVQASAGARKYAGPTFLRHLILAAIEEFPDIPVVMHQDHGASPAACQRSIQLGFSSVMMDGSLLEDQKTPAEYDYNVDVTRRVVDMAHACGVSVEGELGCLGSLESGTAGEEDGVGAEASCLWSRCLLILSKLQISCTKPEWTHWRLPSARLTALINSAARRQATFLPSSRLRRFIAAYRIRIL
jgi:fructose-bisphosphate aldolase class II